MNQGITQNWITGTLGSSVGKKLMMAVTGLSFCGFLTVHLAGNLTLYKGRDAFNHYAATLHTVEGLVLLAELGLLFLALVHITTGMVLFLKNRAARPVRYQVNMIAGGRTIGSATMPYTGLILLAFVVFHLMEFHFVDKTHTTVFDLVQGAFSSPVHVVLYIIVAFTAAIHVSHGLWSAFQTVGINHPRYTPLIRNLGLVFAMVIGMGFGFLPIYIFLMA
ncbi:succinate dehydrogenase cytochrome b subunit [Desulfosarcina sp. OttesenSCG-928-G10]|nr:succinate dehydrogenase cytochrome b subunit [Desulfosarcina sp. OttesenSCG-928-G10]MDL2320792.1 succinate dehydrogenase cytochrome b subunit [Desulfosarcina sp. OttesenSCG-928-B08]